jgi:hypothetical protein
MSRALSENNARFSPKMSFLLPPDNVHDSHEFVGGCARRPIRFGIIGGMRRGGSKRRAMSLFAPDVLDASALPNSSSSTATSTLADDGARCSRPKRVGRFWFNSGLTCCQAAGIWPVNWHPTGGVQITAHPAIDSITFCKGYYLCGNTTSSFGHQFAS